MARLRDARRELVRRGYDAAAVRYREARPGDGRDVGLLSELHARIPSGSRVLDVGCGSGDPIARRLGELGHHVVGVDISLAQLLLASRHGSGLLGVEAEMSALPVSSGSFDAVVSYYAVIHVPRTDHPAVFGEFRRALTTGGWALVCLGAADNPDDHDPRSWLGTAMYWSHFDAETTLGLLVGARFGVAASWDVPDPMDHGSHCFVLAQAV